MTTTVCSVNGCEANARKCGMCTKHYQRMRRRSTTDERVSRAAQLDALMAIDSDDCTPWPCNTRYANVRYNGKATMCHVVACTKQNGPRPDGMEARHLCGTSVCVNPRHLAWGSPQDNSDDKRVHGTMIRGERHPSAKLTATEVRMIRVLIDFGFGPNAIGRLHGVTRTSVRSISTGHHWGWLD